MSDESFNRDWWCAAAMMKYGGEFVKLLGQAFRYADGRNQAKIKATWPEYWEKYSELGEKLRTKEALKP